MSDTRDRELLKRYVRFTAAPDKIRHKLSIEFSSHSNRRDFHDRPAESNGTL